jgi:hypothetical protein
VCACAARNAAQLFMMIILITFVSVVVALELVLVVGTVTLHNARVLLDRRVIDEASSAVTVRVALFSERNQSNSFLVSLGDAAVIVKFDDLTANRDYVATFALNEAIVENVTFSTKHSTPALFTFLSCSRVNQDHDLRTWHQLASRVGNVTVHMGDQIYADWVWKSYKKRDDIGSPAAYADVLRDVRAYYRYAWSQNDIAAVLRHTENWMLADDHDLVNNLGTDLWLKPKMRPFLRAARQTFYEYQFALQADVPISQEALQRCAASGGVDGVACADADAPVRLSRFFQRANVGIALLDIRLERSFLGKDQLLTPEAMAGFELGIRDWVCVCGWMRGVRAVCATLMLSVRRKISRLRQFLLSHRYHCSCLLTCQHELLHFWRRSITLFISDTLTTR